MADTIQFKNRQTGEIITFKKKDTVPVQTKPSRSDEIERDISARGKIQDIPKEIIESPSIVGKGLGVMKGLAIPYSNIEAAISNQAISAQRGNFNPIEMAKQAALGISGQRMGTIGDVAYGAGLPKTASQVIGLGTAIVAPAGVASLVNRTFGKLSKLSDKGIMTAGGALVDASKEALGTVGKRLEDAFSSVNKLPVNPNEYLDAISKMPSSAINKIEEVMKMKLSDLTQPTIEQIRLIKQTLGQFRPGVFGSGERGLAENIDAHAIDSSYGALKKLVENTVASVQGDKAASALMKAEKHFSDTKNASDYIKKAITDATLKKPTKSGEMARRIQIEGDVSARDAINTIRSASKEARSKANKALDALNSFNRWQNASRAAQMAVKAAVFGGAAGAVGGKMVSGAGGSD